MNVNFKHLIIGATASILVACGGGTPSQLVDDVVTEKPDELTGTAAIVVPVDFNFSIESTTKLSISDVPTQQGVVRVYLEAEHHVEGTDTYYPNPSSLIASFSPSETTSFDLQLLASQESIIVEFAPTTDSFDNVYKKVDVNGLDEITIGL